MSQQVPLQFFQAAATAAAALLIALVVGLRFSQHFTESMKPSNGAKRMSGTQVAVWIEVMLLFIGGVIRSLFILAKGHGDKGDAVSLLCIISAMLTTLIVEPLLPSLETVEVLKHSFVRPLVLLGTIVGVLGLSNVIFDALL